LRKSLDTYMGVQKPAFGPPGTIGNRLHFSYLELRSRPMSREHARPQPGAEDRGARATSQPRCRPPPGRGHRPPNQAAQWRAWPIWPPRTTPSPPQLLASASLDPGGRRASGSFGLWSLSLVAQLQLAAGSWSTGHRPASASSASRQARPRNLVRAPPTAPHPTTEPLRPLKHHII
jgi:hypothetical protein